MRDALLVRSFERIGDLAGDAQGVVHRKALPERAVRLRALGYRLRALPAGPDISGTA